MKKNAGQAERWGSDSGVGTDHRLWISGIDETRADSQEGTGDGYSLNQEAGYHSEDNTFYEEPYRSIDPLTSMNYVDGNKMSHDTQADSDRSIQGDGDLIEFGTSELPEELEGLKCITESDKQTQPYNPNIRIKIANAERQRKYDNDIAPKQGEFLVSENKILSSDIETTRVKIKSKGAWNSFLQSTKVNDYDGKNNISYNQDPLKPSNEERGVLLFGGRFIGDGVLGKGGRDIEKNPTAQYCFNFPPALQVIQNQINDQSGKKKNLDSGEVCAMRMFNVSQSLYFMNTSTVLDSREKELSLSDIEDLFSGILATFKEADNTDLHTGFLKEASCNKDPVILQKLLMLGANVCDKKLVIHGEVSDYSQAANELESLARKNPEVSLKSILEEIHDEQDANTAQRLPVPQPRKSLQPKSINKVQRSEFESLPGIKRTEIERNLQVKTLSKRFDPTYREVTYKKRDETIDTHCEVKQKLQKGMSPCQQSLPQREVTMELFSVDMSHDEYESYLKEKVVQDPTYQKRVQAIDENIPQDNGVTGAVFGNRFIGGGIDGAGWVQEEIIFFGTPELRPFAGTKLDDGQSWHIKDVTTFKMEDGGKYFGSRGLNELARQDEDFIVGQFDENDNYNGDFGGMHAKSYRGQDLRPYTVDELLAQHQQQAGLFAGMMKNLKPGERKVYHTGRRCSKP